MSKQKNKLDWLEFIKYLENEKNSHFQSFRYKLVIDNKVNYGTLYKISKPLTDIQKEYLLQFKNTRLYYTQSEYAPELKYNAVFIADRIIK